MKLCEYVNDCFRLYGCEKVFGIPGSTVMPIWQSITGADVVLCSHEQEAAYVATGYGKIKKNLNAVVTIGGPGATNCISGVAASNIDSVPMIYITGRTPIEKNGAGIRQEESCYNRKFDTNDLLSVVSKKSICIDCIEDAPEKINKGFSDAVSGRYGCVHISIPVDIQRKEIGNCSPALQKNNEEKYELVSVASRPLIIMGWGSWMSDSVESIYELAEKINAPVLVTSKAYCCINRNHPCFLGKLGYGYAIFIEDFFRDYDPNQILVFGSYLGEKDIPESIYRYINRDSTIVCGNDLDNVIERYPKLHLVETNDMNGFVRALLISCRETVYQDKVNVLIQRTKRKQDDYWRHRIQEQDFMSKVILSIGEKSDIRITADAGNHLLNAGALISPEHIGGLFLDVGLRAMGSGICSTVGMAFADTRMMHVSITGDGCMLMNGNVMHLIKKYNLPILIILFNNHSLGRVRVGQSVMNDYRGTDINDVDFGTYARAFGITSYRTSDINSFNMVFEKCLDAGSPALIEVICSADEVPVTLKDRIY